MCQSQVIVTTFKKFEKICIYVNKYEELISWLAVS